MTGAPTDHAHLCGGVPGPALYPRRGDNGTRVALLNAGLAITPSRGPRLCFIDLASRAYRRAKAALCGYSEPLKLSHWRVGRFRPAPRIGPLDTRPVALQR